MKPVNLTPENCEAWERSQRFPLIGFALAFLMGLFTRKPRPARSSRKKLNPTGEELTPEKLITFKGLSHLTRQQAENATETVKKIAMLVYRAVNPRQAL